MPVSLLSQARKARTSTVRAFCIKPCPGMECRGAFVFLIQNIEGDRGCMSHSAGSRPKTVIVRFPSAALLPTVIFMVELPAPLIEDGVKVMEVELPCPVADKAIAELKPPLTAVLMVTVPELLLAMLMPVGDALIEKPGVVPVTVE